MVVDTSAILAILFDESEAEEFSRKIASAATLAVSAAILLEVTAVLRQRTKTGDDRDLMNFLAVASPTIVPFDEAQYMIARDAFHRFGKGSGQPARLNFGDCFAYALAKRLELPLLFKGNDFSHTDLATG
jgi:ribonuclease VapC